MTCLEKFKLDHPIMAAKFPDEYIRSITCPDELGYSTTVETNVFCNSNPDRMPCRECWNRQVKEVTANGI